MAALRFLAALFIALAATGAVAAERVALLIGNNNYGGAPLRNAVNDAKDLGDALKELGFKVIVRENATRKDMIEGILEFGTALEGAKTAFFFYAGHAMQFKDRNYLIPIDIAMGSEEDVTFFALDISQVFDRMDKDSSYPAVLGRRGPAEIRSPPRTAFWATPPCPGPMCAVRICGGGTTSGRGLL